MTPAERNESLRVASIRSWALGNPYGNNSMHWPRAAVREELFVVSITHEFSQRVRCYELLMQTN